MFRCGARILVEGNIKQNFIHDSSLSSPVLQWSRQTSVREGGDIQQKCTHKRLIKTFSKIYKQNLHKNLTNSPKFFKDKI